jgi:hypothetical protein
MVVLGLMDGAGLAGWVVVLRAAGVEHWPSGTEGSLHAAWGSDPAGGRAASGACRAAPDPLVLPGMHM